MRVTEEDCKNAMDSANYVLDLRNRLLIEADMAFGDKNLSPSEAYSAEVRYLDTLQDLDVNHIRKPNSEGGCRVLGEQIQPHSSHYGETIKSCEELRRKSRIAFYLERQGPIH